MNSLQCIKEHMEKLVKFLTPLLPLANTHNTEFITKDLLNTFLPEQLRLDLLHIEFGKLNLVATADIFKSCQKNTHQNFMSNTSLEEFLTNIKQLRDDGLKLFTPLEKIQETLVETDLKMLTKLMRQKKAHEVNNMSQVVAKVCKDKGIHQVIDIGCGVGYLSAFLLIKYQLKVLAVDASSSNIASTLKKGKAFKKVCRSTISKRSKREKTKETTENQENKKLIIKKSPKEKENQNGAENLNFVEGKMPTNAQLNLINEKSSHKNEVKNGVKFFYEHDGNFIGITKFVTEKENLPKLIASSAIRNGKFIPLHPLSDLCVVGLHTCGNLAPTSLKIYTFNPNAKFLCNVSCCYHLLDEEFSTDTFRIQKFDSSDPDGPVDDRYESLELDPLHQKRSSSPKIGFPLSSFLKDLKFALGRNARNLATKAIYRLSISDKSLKTLFWRALLELIVTDLHGSWPKDAFVGKIKDCSSFYEYCIQGIKNIGFEELEIEENVALKYLEEFKTKESELIRFYFLKASLSPLIESLIHLDRLCFLVEQGFANSHLVQIFDSAVSPRSTAIISFK